jgi:uncharacterized membrane protein (DUF485 family)
LGAVFILFGVIIHKFPVPITITSLVLYIGAIAIFAYIQIANSGKGADQAAIIAALSEGIIFKIIIIVSFIKAIQAAISYQRELNNSGVQADAFST